MATRSRTGLLLIVVLAAPLIGWAEGVTLEIQPAPIAVSPSYSEVKAVAILKNGSKAVLQQLQLSALTNDGLLIELSKPSSPKAEPDQAVVWTIRIKAPAQARLPASALFEVKYRQSSQGSCFRRFASLAVTSQTDAKPVAVSIDGNFEAISGERPGVGSLVLTNDLDAPVHVEVQPLVDPQRMTISRFAPIEIPGRSAVEVPFQVFSAGRITPGSYPISLEVTTSWTWAGRKEERHVVVSKPGTLGVFFESEVLKALGVPSFLVLPGCLVILTMQLMLAFNILGAKNESNLPDLGVTTPGFWILSITYSGFFALLYSLFGGTNYLVRYGAQDLMLVWLISIGVGFAFYMVLAWWTFKRRQERTPTAEDQPLTVLGKIARNGLGLMLPEVRFTMGNNQWRGFVIEPLKEGKTTLWVARPMETFWGGTAAALAGQTAMNNDVNAAMAPNPAEAPAVIAERVATRLTQAKTTGLVDVRWNTQGQPPSMPYPYHVKTESITEYLAPGRILT